MEATNVRPDTPRAIAFLKQWKTHGPWSLTAIAMDKKSLETRTFTDDDPAADWIISHNGKRNIYFLVNTPTRPISGNQHAQVDEIQTVDWLHVDIDPRVGEDLTEERERALRLLQTPPNGVPPATVIVFSGGGYQGFWRLAEPLVIGGNRELGEDAKLWNLGLERTFGADTCHNVNRIMRLPGTVNLPDEKKAAKGRVPGLANVVSWDETRVYPLSAFQKSPLVAMGKEAGGTFASATDVTISGNVPRLASVAELDKYDVPERIKVIIVQGHNRDLEGTKNDDSRSGWLFDCLCGLARANVPPDTMYAIITDRDFKISESVLDKSDPDKYARRQIGRAIEIAKDPILAKINEQHAVICNYGGGCVVAEEITEVIGGTPHTTLTTQSFSDFTNRYCNQKVRIGDKNGQDVFAPLGKWWLMHEDRRQYDTVTFSPGQDTPGRYNLWKGFAVEPRQGTCQKYLDHVLHNICSGEQTHYDYLLAWMARAVQCPGEQGHVAVVLRGKKGTGKGTFASIFGSLFGNHYLPVSNSTHMVGKFNAHLRSCVVLFADEAFFAGDKQHESVLKTLITEATMVVEGKHKDAVVSPNCTHIVMASNESWVVPAGAEERRFFVLDVSDSAIQDKAYFNAIDEESRNGGREALLYMLLNFDISTFQVRTAPKTIALQDQQMISMSPLQEWWFQKLDEGRLLAAHEFWKDEAVVDLLYQDYINIVSLQRGVRPAAKTTWSKQVVSFFPKQTVRRVQKIASIPVEDVETGRLVLRDRRCSVWLMPDLDACRKCWEQRIGKLTWTEPTPIRVPDFELLNGEQPF